MAKKMSTDATPEGFGPENEKWGADAARWKKDAPQWRDRDASKFGPAGPTPDANETIRKTKKPGGES